MLVRVAWEEAGNPHQATERVAIVEVDNNIPEIDRHLLAKNQLLHEIPYLSRDTFFMYTDYEGVIVI